MNDIYIENKDDEEKSSHIDLFGQYAITVDKYNFTLYKVGVSRKSGKEYMNIIGHYSSLDKALIACKKDYTKRVIMDSNVLSLDDAVAIIVRANNRFESLVKNAFEGVAV